MKISLKNTPQGIAVDLVNKLVQIRYSDEEMDIIPFSQIEREELPVLTIEFSPVPKTPKGKEIDDVIRVLRKHLRTFESIGQILKVNL